MELKMRYSYSYFIYPYIIKEINFKKYIHKLLKNKKFTPKFFEREKDVSIYNFFLPNIRRYMFKSFDFAKNENRQVKKLEDNLVDNMFKTSPCMMFDYNIGDDVQAKAGENDGIFFKINNISVICFETGICFMILKTNIQDTDKFSDLLNFNVKFRDVNSECAEHDLYRNIKIQTSTFDDIKRLSEVIKEITGNVEDAKKIDIDINRFLTFSYVCLDQEYWNDIAPFSEIQKEFFKFANVLNSEFNSSFINDRLKVINFGNYTKVGISRAGINLLTSSINTVNYTNLPFEFENEYLYTYILALYERFYFSKLLNDFKSLKKYKITIKKFIEFTNDIWVHEITNNDNGIMIFKYTKEVFNINEMYETVKEQYDVVYKNFNVKSSEILNRIILVLLAVSILTNVVNFVNLYKLK